MDSYEIPRSRIQFIKEIGEGAFGQVFLAKAFNVGNQIGYTHVAVKTLRGRYFCYEYIYIIFFTK